MSSRPVQDLFSSQEEADTRMILHSLVSKQPHVNIIIVVRSPDTDVFLLLMSYLLKQLENPSCLTPGYETIGDK